MQQWQVVEGARQMYGRLFARFFSPCSTTGSVAPSIFATSSGRTEQLPFNGVVQGDGELFCNASTWRDRAYGGDRLYFRLAKRLAVRSGRNIRSARITGERDQFGFPVRDAGNAGEGLAFAGLDLADLAGWPRRLPCHRGVLSVIDVKGTILSRKPALKERVGQKTVEPAGHRVDPRRK